VEAQYIKAPGIFIIFEFWLGLFSQNNGILPYLLTLLAGTCLDQASQFPWPRKDQATALWRQPFPLTGWYGVQRIEAPLSVVRHGEVPRPYLTQLTAMWLTCAGSMIAAGVRQAHRNFQAVQILLGHAAAETLPNDVAEIRDTGVSRLG